MCIPFERKNILESYAKTLAAELLSGNLKETVAVEKMSRLAYLLDMTGEEGIIELSNVCTKQNLRLALSITSKIEDLEMKPANVYNKVSSLVGTLTSFYNPVGSDSLLIELFTTTTDTIVRSCLTFSPDCQLNNICRWVGLLGIRRGNSKSTLKTVFGDPSPTPASAVLVHNIVQNLIYCYLQTCRNSSIPVTESFNSMLAQLPDKTIESRELMVTWQKLREEQQDLSCIRLIIEYYWSQKAINPSFQESTVIKFLTQCVKDLLRKLFRLRNFDLELALLLLHFFNKEDAMHFLIEETQSAGYNYQRLNSISHLALTYSSLNKIDKYTKVFRTYHTSCKWAKKLNELGLPYKDAFKDSDTEHKQLLIKLIAQPSTNINLLNEFCLDKCFDQQECLMMYLEYLLLNWYPDMHVTEESSSGKKVMVVKNSCGDILDQCRTILHHLGTKSVKSESTVISWNESIQNDLCKLWNKINHYYYEIYVIMTDLYQRVLSDQVALKQIIGYKDMLEFLQTYTRISSPSENEQEQWFQLFPNTNNLPPISNFRLPFTPFFGKDPPWGFIKPELSLNTYKTWYNIIPILGLERDMLCTLTIQRLTSDQLTGGAKDKSSWHLKACNQSVLEEIQECVKNIRNQEMASAALYYVVNHMPPGADQTAAATFCYMQAKQWISQDNSEKARTGFNKVQKKYLTVCTSHLLHKHRLGQPEYLQLVLRPQELIVALYEDPCILKRKTGTISNCPDINRVVLEIGELHDVNVVAIQQELLSEWLYPPENPQFDMSSDDITQNIAAIHTNSAAPSDDDSIIRACYVLESMDVEVAARYLVSYAEIREEVEHRPKTVMLRALQCLCSIATTDVVVKTTGRTIENIRANMQYLMFTSELEKLGLVWSIKGFETCDKEDVVRILLTKGSPQAVQVAAAMGCAYKLTNVQYWDQIIQYMTSYTMVDELSIVLPELTALCHLLSSSIFTAAWNCALITPLLKAECPLTEECIYRVQRALELLFRCPVPRQVDLPSLLKHCSRLKNEEFVARLQPFLFLAESSQQLVNHH